VHCHNKLNIYTDFLDQGLFFEQCFAYFLKLLATLAGCFINKREKSPRKRALILYTDFYRLPKDSQSPSTNGTPSAGQNNSFTSSRLCFIVCLWAALNATG